MSNQGQVQGHGYVQGHRQDRCRVRVPSELVADSDLSLRLVCCQVRTTVEDREQSIVVGCTWLPGHSWMARRKTRRAACGRPNDSSAAM